jgi:glycosyltransferase involved in cell wall biosynthesis
LAEHHFFKKIYFGMEAKKLARFEQVLKYASELLCISPNDNFYFDHHFGHSHFIPAFHPFSEIKSKPGKGRYVLFHGNLSVAENFQAAEFLVTQVLGQTRHEVIIAGKNPPDRLIRKIGLHSNIQLVANPDNEQMENLIRQAHICLLPTFQDTGLKLKLLASLFSGRFCIANTPMVHKTGLEHLCHIADTPEEMIRLIDELFIHDFPAEEIEKRRLILEDVFSNHENALKIIRLIEEKSKV